MPKYFEFEVSLCDVRPKIWRRFLLPVKSSFLNLHEAIQDAGEWWNYHMFLFHRPGRERKPIAGIPEEHEWDIFGEPTPDAHKVKLDSFFGEGMEKSCLYEYDFGDSWEHKVKLVRVVDLPEVFRRRLVGGARAFPHEDSGGMSGYWRYVEFLQTGKDPCGEDPEEIRRWLGGWEPDHFDLEAVKAKFDQAWVKR